MDIWILTALLLRDKLDSAASKYDRRIEDEALDLRSDALEVYDRVSALCDLKRRIVNLKVLCDRMESGLTQEEFSLLVEYTLYGTQALAVRQGGSRMAVYRTVRRALLKAAAVLKKSGYDEGRMNEDYLSIPLCASAYKKLCALKKRSAEREEGKSMTAAQNDDSLSSRRRGAVLSV